MEEKLVESDDLIPGGGGWDYVPLWKGMKCLEWCDDYVGVRSFTSKIRIHSRI